MTCPFSEGRIVIQKVIQGQFYNSVGRTDFVKSSSEDLINSIKTKLMTLDDDIIVLPGHDARTTIGEERMHNPFL